MSSRNFSAPSRQALDRLLQLRQFSGGAAAFWTQFAEVTQELTIARQVRCMVQLNGVWNLLASAPVGMTNPRAFLQGTFEEHAATVLQGGGGLTVPAEAESGALHVLHALHTEEGAAKCILELRFGPGEGPTAGAEMWTGLLPLLADTPRIYQKNLSVVALGQDVGRMREALDVLAVVNGQRSFAPASMALVNEMAARMNAERVCLGWLSEPYIRVVAVSGTEKFERKMQILQELEAAMEECRDQDEELVWPAPSGSLAVYHDHEVYARRSGSDCLLSIPVRDEQQVVGVLTVERKSPPFTEQEAWGLRVIADQVAARMADLRKQSRWFAVRWAQSWRKGLEKVLSPRHTWLKFWVIVSSVLLMFCLLVPLPYRVSATFIVRPDSLAHLPAPFEGFIASSGVRPGDVVTAGDVLVALDTRDLLIEHTETLAEIRRHEAQAELAEAKSELAELRISRAQLGQAQARAELLQYRLERAAIRAPFDGVVVQGDLRERIGAPVGQGEVLLQVSDLAGLYVEIRLPERDIDLLGDSSSGAVVFASRPDIQFPIDVVMISPAAQPDPEGNAFVLRAVLLDEEDWLRPGMSGVARIDSEKRTLAWRATHRIIDFIRMRIWL